MEEKKMKSTSESNARKRVGGSTKSTRRSVGSVPTSGNNYECPREQMVAEAAYFRAERRGFAPGNEMSDWLQAEVDVESVLHSAD
jgi:hypothetical protein